MKYQVITAARFICRPNRFIAEVDIHSDAGNTGGIERVHVKNTGRCRELLTENAECYLAEGTNPGRRTRYDLIAVRKGSRLINMDSQAPNKAAAEWLRHKVLFPDLQKLTPEYTCGDSRFDFLIETGTGADAQKILLEVKGVTLEQDGIVYFPDAPSERAVKHVNGLARAVKEGYQAYVLFVIQMEGVDYFTANRQTHEAFARALSDARESGVRVLAYDSLVTPDSMEINREVPVKLSLLDEIALPLLRWYDVERRILPWREEATPYHVWVSEIMLQQTRVQAVKTYYERFIRALPDLDSLAHAEEDRLLKLWEGLGYYNRARNLQKCARHLIADYGGIMPADYHELQQLPGIGSYTAGAISSICYGRAVPAVDGNVLRVLARLRADSRDIAAAETRKQVERELAAVIPADRPGDFNQALMELGALICLPNGKPKCDVCPWQGFCQACLTGRTADLPIKRPKPSRSREAKTILVVCDENKVALRKRPARGLLSGMYEFPAVTGHLSQTEALAYLTEIGLKVLRIKPLPPSKHIFTHKEWYMTGYAVQVDELAERQPSADGLIFVETVTARDQYPIPAAYAAYTDYLFSQPDMVKHI